MKRETRACEDETKKGGMAKRMMIVDDHPLVREGLSTLIQNASETGLDVTICAAVGSAEEAEGVLLKIQPDVLLLDLSLPGKSGLEFLKETHTRYPQIRILVVSMHDETVYAERALCAGAQGYIMKHEPGPKVIEAVRCVLRGELFVSSSVARHLLKHFVANRQGIDMRSSVERLSNRELQVFSSIGQGKSSQEIADTFRLSVKTVQTYRENIKRKLGARNATELIRQATQWVAADVGATGS